MTQDAQPGSPVYRVPEAAALLGVSADTVRRWADAGKLRSTRDGSGRRLIDAAALAEFATQLGRSALAGVGPTGGHSARNRFPGIVTRVVKDTVMAHVELQAGPFRLVSLMSREAADELRLAPGVTAVASVKATNVTVELPAAPSHQTS
ncbi:MAG TPA: helix-turn-helix transcriptional regulator [Acidimicrobiales bacterium]|nr:helix-turn-helix transcriptional regulator [Acidimicrobiales bacterium]